MITEEQASQGLNITGYAGKWQKAKQKVALKVDKYSADYWPNVRKYFIELGGEWNTGPGTFKEFGEITFNPTHLLHLINELRALPNAFDSVTGKINSENDQAVMLYEVIKLGFAYSKYPIKWGIHE